MKIAIMQPYFFPYLGYFDLMQNVDLFLIYDKVQFIKQGWINRNRVLNPSKSGWQYFSIPLNRSSFRDSYRTPILDIKVTNNSLWKERLIRQLAHYKKEAPFFEETINLVNESLKTDEAFLSRVNVYALECCARRINLDFQFKFISDLNIKWDIEKNAENKILDLCELFGAKEYVNLPGGIDLYHQETFQAHNIKLTFRNLPTYIYPTGTYIFEKYLSIIDILMWNRTEDVKKYLDDHRTKEQIDV